MNKIILAYIDRTNKIINDYGILVLLTVILIIAIYFGFFYSAPTIEAPSECGNQSVEDTSECLVNYVKGFYIYNITQGENSLLEEELRTSGGDCSEWGVFYKETVEDLGFKAQLIDFFNGHLGHRIVLVWDKNYRYCVIDQIKVVGCWHTGNSTNEIQNNET